MRKYVISVSENNGPRYYIQVSDGVTKAVQDKSDATSLPNRTVAMAVVSAIKSKIKKEKLNVIIGTELY